ncbi:MAG: TonB-dependent receptor [Marinifilum sp.]|jgi:TonB-linked SusC/RagA family outer membrane protein|nr:TonB-dependent receptor [Marinifilum sp.]
MNFIVSNYKIRSIFQYLLILGLAFVTSFSYAQGKKIKGVVLDDNGLELPGVSILEKGTTNGTVTSINGKFELSVGNKAVIVASFIGFENQEITVGNQTDFKIVMAPDVQQLDQVVVVGYGRKSIKDVTGAITSVKPEDLAKAPVANFDQALSGRMAGVQVNFTDAQPGEGMNIIIRGGNSITGSNKPLYVIDGIPMEDFDSGSINAHDIESYDVLKDASATAIYGSRGANGVIIINTKSGIVGPAKVSVNSSVGIQRIPERLDVMSPYEFVKLQQEIAIGKGGDEPQNFINNWVDPEKYRNVKGTNWQDEIFKSAIIHNHTIGISGGNEKTTHNMSLNYLNQEGTLINTGYEKFNGKIKLDHKLSDKIKAGANVNYSWMEQSGVKVASNNRVSVIMDALTSRPVEPINSDGLENGVDPDDPDNLRYNPVKTLNNTDKSKRWSVFRANAYTQFELMKGLEFKVTGGYVSDNRKESVFYNADTRQAYKEGISGRLIDRLYTTLSTSNTLNYNTKIAGSHKIGALLGYEYSVKKNEFFTAGSKDMPLDNLNVHSLQVGATPELPTSFKSKHVMQSYFSRLDYSFREKYLFTASYRVDGSSRFLGDNKWGFFPSFSMGWRLIEEPFINDLNIFSNLKLRAGWGATGNNRVPNESAYTLMISNIENGYVFNNIISKGFGVSRLADENLKWETTYQYNAGIDFGFFDGRLSATIDVYKKNTKDLLLDASMAPSTSFKTIWTNIGEVENKGIEFSFTSRNIETKDFTWSTNFNISMNRNKVVALTGGASELKTDPGWNSKIKESQYISRVGSSVGQFYGLRSDGLYQVEDFNYVNGKGYVLKKDIPLNGSSEVIPGSEKFKDLNGDGNIDEKDRTVIGSAEPKHFGGLGNDFSYKGFDLSIFFQWSYGNDILNVNKVLLESPGIGYNYNYMKSVENRYTPTNPGNYIHIVRGENSRKGAAPEGNRVSDRMVEDGSYLKLKTVSLGYNFSKSFLKKTCFSKARVYVAAQNLYTWTNYSGYDPEVSVGRKGALTPGLDYSSYPASTTLTFGVNLKF